MGCALGAGDVKHKILPVQKAVFCSALGLSTADLTVVFTMKFWRTKPGERLNAILLKYALVNYFSALSKHYM